jgi:hypothetical protein
MSFNINKIRWNGRNDVCGKSRRKVIQGIVSELLKYLWASSGEMDSA